MYLKNTTKKHFQLKLLFAANRFPYPPFRGDKLKIFNLASILSQQHELHLLTFLQDKNDLQYLPKLEKVFTKIHLVPLPKSASVFQALKALFSAKPLQVGFFKSNKMEEKINQLLAKEQYDAVHVQHLRLAQYWYSRKTIPRILDLPDAYSLYWKRRVKSSSGPKKWFNFLEYNRVFKYESILDDFNLSLVCSQEDLHYLKKEKQIQTVQLLPNGVDCKQFSFPENNYQEDTQILFTGNMDYEPNIDAVEYFVQEIFPLIKKEIPKAKFVIAGQRPVEAVKKLANEDIQVTGFIPKLSDIYKTAAIVVAPLRFGAGTQNKVLEAMATGIPVVSRNIGFKGLGITSGEGVVLALETQDFADACVQLLKDATLRKSIGEKGEQIVRERYDWPVIAGLLEKYFIQIQDPKTTTK